MNHADLGRDRQADLLRNLRSLRLTESRMQTPKGLYEAQLNHYEAEFGMTDEPRTPRLDLIDAQKTKPMSFSKFMREYQSA